MRTPVLIRTNFSDRMLPLALPRRNRRGRRADRPVQALPALQLARALDGRHDVARDPQTNRLPLRSRGAIDERFIRQVGLDFFSATASSLFGDTPEAWADRARRTDVAEVA